MFSKWLAYDLESTFLQKGFKRTDTKIIEIALYGKNFNTKTSKGESYQALVNPLEKYSTGLEVIESLNSIGQNPDKSINFWVKLLSQKRMMDSSVRRKSIADKADALAKTLSSEDYEFKTTKQALQEAIEFGKDHVLIAHNGNAFDSKIMQGNAKEYDIDISDVQFNDSLPMFKYYFDDEPSYSQPLLYKRIIGKTYKAHHALEDSKALHRLIRECSGRTEREVIPMFGEVPVPKKRSYKKKIHPDSDLYDIKGVGPKSVGALFDNDIKTKKELHSYIASNEMSTWLKDFTNVHAYKKLGNDLFSGKIVLV